MSLRHGPIQLRGLMSRRTGVIASEMVKRFSVVEPVENEMVAVGSAPRLLVTAPHTRIPSGQRQAIQVSVLRKTKVERVILSESLDPNPDPYSLIPSPWSLVPV